MIGALGLGGFCGQGTSTSVWVPNSYMNSMIPYLLMSFSDYHLGRHRHTCQRELLCGT